MRYVMMPSTSAMLTITARCASSLPIRRITKVLKGAPSPPQWFEKRSSSSLLSPHSLHPRSIAPPTMLLSNYPRILLGLVASVSAINVYFHVCHDCGGASVRCSNLNPGVCCSGYVVPSIGYRGIPTHWWIYPKGYSRPLCEQGHQIDADAAPNTNFKCLRATGRRQGQVFVSTHYEIFFHHQGA